MNQHDPTAHTGAIPGDSEARWEPSAFRPRSPYGEPAARLPEVPDPNSLPTDWSPSGTAHAGSNYADAAYGMPPNAPVSEYTPAAPAGFTSVDSPGYDAVVSARRPSGHASSGSSGHAAAASPGYDSASSFGPDVIGSASHGSGDYDSRHGSGGYESGRGRRDYDPAGASGFAPPGSSSFGSSGDPGSARVAWLPASAAAGDTHASQGRPGEGWGDTPGETGYSKGRSERRADFDPASSWNGNTTMGAERITSDRERNPWGVTPVPDRIPSEWDDADVPDSIPASWTEGTGQRPEPPTVTWNIPSAQGRPTTTERQPEYEAATERWNAVRPGSSDEPESRAWNAVPDGHQGSWDAAATAGQTWNGESRAIEAAQSAPVPRTQAGFAAAGQPEPVAVPGVPPTSRTRRSPKLTLVAALIAAALAGGAVGAGIVAFVGGETAPAGDQVPNVQVTPGT